MTSRNDQRSATASVHIIIGDTYNGPVAGSIVGGSGNVNNMGSAWTALHPNVPTQDVPSPSPLFQGRRSELGKLKEYFRLRAPDELRARRALLLYGMGGIGKTQICRKFAEEASDRFAYIFWIDGSTPETISLDLQNLPAAKVASPDGAVRPILKWISGLKEEWLMIFDNAEEHIHSFIPSGNLGNILITSRNLSVGRSTASRAMEVVQMTEEDAISLLLKASCLDQAPISATLHDTARAISQELHCLPLAVDQAGAAIESGLCSINDYLRLYSSCRKWLLDDQPFKVASSYEQTVYGTWELSYKKIESISLNGNLSESQSGTPFTAHQALTAIAILQILAHFHHDNISMEIFKAAWTNLVKAKSNRRPRILHNHDFLQQNENGEWDELHFRNGIRVLLRFSLVKQGSSNTIYSIHPLVHSWSQDRLPLNQQQVRWQEARKLLAWSIDSSNLTTAGYQFRQHLVPHILANSQCYKWVQDEDIDDQHDCRVFGQVVGQAGIWPKAEELFHKAIEKGRRDLGPEHLDTLTSMDNLASIFRNRGKFTDAAKLGKEVFDTCQRVLGAEHPDTLSSMANLASTFRNQGRYAEAEKLGKEVLELRWRVLGTDHPNTLDSMNSLASTFQEQGRFREAEVVVVEALNICQRLFGPDHPCTLDSMVNLAGLFMNQGKFGKAEELGMEVLNICQRALGPEHPDTLISMSNLALAFHNQGRFGDAEALGMQVLDVYHQVLGLEHRDTLISMANLAHTFRKCKKFAEAEKLELNVLNVRRRVLGPEHPDTLLSMANLACTLGHQGRFVEAEELEVEVLDLRQRVLGPDHPATLKSVANLTCTLKNQGRFSEAEKMQVEVLDVYCQLVGKEHPDTLTSMVNLAITLRDQALTIAYPF